MEFAALCDYICAISGLLLLCTSGNPVVVLLPVNKVDLIYDLNNISANFHHFPAKIPVKVCKCKGPGWIVDNAKKCHN